MQIWSYLGEIKRVNTAQLYLAEFCTRHMDRNTQVGTDRPCILDISRILSVPPPKKKNDDFDVSNNWNNQCIAPTSVAFHAS